MLPMFDVLTFNGKLKSFEFNILSYTLYLYSINNYYLLMADVYNCPVGSVGGFISYTMFKAY